MSQLDDLLKNAYALNEETFLNLFKLIIKVDPHYYFTDNNVRDHCKDVGLNSDKLTVEDIDTALDKLQESKSLQLTKSDQLDSVVYSMFPIKDQDAWVFYCKQEAADWSAKELDFLPDIENYKKLRPRYKELFNKILGFFVPGDGLIAKNVGCRFLNECDTYEESLFYNIQLKIEATHAESYSSTAISCIPDQKEQQEVFGAVDNIEAVKIKADFMKKYIDSNLPKELRMLASACSEGIFFVALFAIIFYFRDKHVMKTFIFMNEQISKDETLHRDFYCNKIPVCLCIDDCIIQGIANSGIRA